MKPYVKRGKTDAVDAEAICEAVAWLTIRLIDAVLLKANDEWQLQHRYMSAEALAELQNPIPANEALQLPPKAA